MLARSPPSYWICALALLQCALIGFVSGRVVLEEADESVVSIYTTVAPPATKHITDIYHQIASNVVERVREPIYKIFGIQKNETTSTTNKPEAQQQKRSKKIEILEETDQNEVNPIDNEIDVGERDVEEISKEHLDKQSKRKKPERLSEKTDVQSNIKKETAGEVQDLNKFANDFFDTNSDLVESINATTTADPDVESFDDFDNPGEKAEGNPFSYVAEWLNNLISLFWGFVDVLWASDAKS